MYNNDGILIKGNRDGINTTINMNKFSSFEDMITLLVKKLSKGKHFYQGTTLILRIDLKLLNEKNYELNVLLKDVLMTIKRFFRKLLQLGSEMIKNITTSEIKQYYDENYFDKKDVINISVGTSEETELFDYVDYKRYYGISKYNELEDDYDNKDDFEIGM